MWSQTIPADVQEVLETSAVLQISEFRVFSLAYSSWYGREGKKKTLERHFTPYMFHEEVPFWVRRYTRGVLELERQGRLEPGALGIEAPPGDPSTLRLGLIYSFLIGMSLIGLLLLAEAAVVTLGIETCWLPPCY